MKRNSLLLFALLIFVGLKINYAQAPDWTRVLQTNTYGEQLVDVVDVDANSTYSAISFSGPTTFEGSNYTSIGYRDLFLVKTNYSGTITWIKQLNAQAKGTIYANAIKADASGNIYVTGIISGSSTIGSSTISSLDNSDAVFLAKFDSDGNGLWATTLFYSFEGSTIRIATDASSNAYLICNTSKLIKISSTGTKTWEQTYPENTIQAIAIYGSNLYIGGCLQSGTTTFGTIPLTSLGSKNTGFLVKADLAGEYSNSIVVGGSTSSNEEGSTVTDIIFDNSGNLIITGGYEKDLILGTISITNTYSNHYTYIAKCDNNLIFTWAKSSSTLDYYSNTIYLYRLFIDNTGNIYQFGLNVYRIAYESVSVTPSNNQFLIKFDSNGNPLEGWALTRTNIGRVALFSDGKVFLGKYFLSDGSTYGNFSLTQLNGDLTLGWEKISSNSQYGTVKINYTKHDSIGNTYTHARVSGNCNYFGTPFNTITPLTIISKCDINGNLLWLNQISDISPNLLGKSFELDKDNNILFVGVFKTSLTIGTTTLTSSNSNYEGYVAKYNSSGVFQWASKMNLGENVSNIITVTSDNNSNVLVSGFLLSRENYIIKFNSSGNQIWAKSFDIEADYISQVTTDANNNIYITSESYLAMNTGSATIGTLTFNQSPEDGTTVLIKFDPAGNALWVNTYGGVSGASVPSGFPCNSKTDAAGNTYLWGWCEDNAKFGTNTFTNPFTPNENFSFYLTKINTSGDVVWAKAIYEKKFAYNYGDLLDLDNNGNIYVGGHFIDKISVEGTEYSPEGQTDFFVIKYNNNGTFDWIKTIPSNAPKGGFINSLGIFEKNTLSIVGDVGKNSTLGGTSINSKGGSNGIIATLGNLKYIRVSSNTLNVAAAANSTNNFNVTSNIDWSANSNQTWLTISSTNGFGNAFLTLTATANPLITARTATVTISGDGISDQTISVTQDAGAPVLSVSSNSLAIAAPANSTNTFNITSNINWSAISDQTWLTLSSGSGSNNATITVTAASNPSATTRTANITVSGANVTTKTVVVTQDLGTSGVNDIYGLKAINIFPNPNNGRFKISLNHYSNETIDVTITDAVGNTIQNFSLNGLPENYTDEINLGNIAKGLYFVIVKTNKSKVVKTITVIN